jgi:hypothetical protein
MVLPCAPSSPPSHWLGCGEPLAWLSSRSTFCAALGNFSFPPGAHFSAHSGLHRLVGLFVRVARAEKSGFSLRLLWLCLFVVLWEGFCEGEGEGE